MASHNLFYDCAGPGDMLTMSLTLNRDGEPLLTRGPEMHGWLTGFRWGVLSDASELSVDLAITPVEVAAIEEANSTVVSAYQAEGFPSSDPNVVDAEFLDVAVPQHAAHGRLLRLGREASWRAN